MKKIVLLLLLLSAILFARPVVTVSIEPQRFFIEKIAKNKVRVKTLFVDGNMNQRLKKITVKETSFTDAFFTIGLPIETIIVEKVLTYSPNVKIFDMSKGIKKISTNGIDNPYIWLDPIRMRKLASNVLIALIELDGRNRAFYQENHDLFLDELDDLYLKVKEMFYTTVDGVYVFNEKWIYFSNRFEIDFYTAENRVLKAEDISGIIDQSKYNKITKILIEPSFDYKIAQSLSSNSNANIVEDNIFVYEWFSNIYYLAEKLVEKK